MDPEHFFRRLVLIRLTLTYLGGTLLGLGLAWLLSGCAMPMATTAPPPMVTAPPQMIFRPTSPAVTYQSAIRSAQRIGGTVVLFSPQTQTLAVQVNPAILLYVAVDEAPGGARMVLSTSIDPSRSPIEVYGGGEMWMAAIRQQFVDLAY